MSLAPIEMKGKRVSTMGTGVHLVLIDDILYLRDAVKEPMLTAGKKTLVVIFKNDKSEVHEQHYLMDGGWRQEQFTKVLKAAQVPLEGSVPKKKDALHKRLWIAIKEVNYVDNDVVVSEDGVPKKEYYIFRVSPFIENGRKPAIVGDPADNNGNPTGAFIDYKNVAIQEETGEVPKMTEMKTTQDVQKVQAAVKTESKVTIAEIAKASPNIIIAKPAAMVPEKPMLHSEKLKEEQPTFEEPKTKSDSINWDEVPNF